MSAAQAAQLDSTDFIQTTRRASLLGASSAIRTASPVWTAPRSAHPVLLRNCCRPRPIFASKVPATPTRFY